MNTASNFTKAELPFTVVDHVESCLLLQGVVSGSFEQTRSTQKICVEGLGM